MSKAPPNPSRFGDMLTEKLYATGTKGQKLKAKREDLVNWLHKKGKEDHQCLSLADKLEACTKRHRCHSAACSECAHSAQRLIAKVTWRFLKSHSNEGTTVCVTVAPADGCINPGELEQGIHQRAIRRWKEKLGKAGIGWFIGATDLSFNEHVEERYEPHWSLHFYGITVTRNPEKLKRKLLQQFPKSDPIPRPIKVMEWNGSKKALRYLLKPNFWRRVATDEAKRHNKDTGTTRSCRATEKQRLRSRHKRELLNHLDEIGSQNRLLFRWCQIINVKEKGPTITLRGPKGVCTRK
jgi:hypothetical protein